MEWKGVQCVELGNKFETNVIGWGEEEGKDDSKVSLYSSRRMAVLEIEVAIKSPRNKSSKMSSSW